MNWPFCYFRFDTNTFVGCKTCPKVSFCIFIDQEFHFVDTIKMYFSKFGENHQPFY